MSGQKAAENELSMAQTITALRSENTVLKEQLALVQQQYEWLKKQEPVFTTVKYHLGGSFPAVLR